MAEDSQTTSTYDESKLSQDPRNGKLADYALRNDLLIADMKETIRNWAYGDIMHGQEPDRQSVAPGIEGPMKDAAESYIGPSGPEPGGRPFTASEIRSAVQQVIDSRRDIINEGIQEGSNLAAEEYERHRRDMENGTQIEGLPEGWVQSDTGQGYVIKDPEGRTEYEYDDGTKEHRWRDSEWIYDDMGDDPVQIIREGLQEGQSKAADRRQDSRVMTEASGDLSPDRVNDLVQVTHATGETVEGDQVLQARHQLTRQTRSLDQSMTQ